MFIDTVEHSHFKTVCVGVSYIYSGSYKCWGCTVRPGLKPEYVQVSISVVSMGLKNTIYQCYTRASTHLSSVIKSPVRDTTAQPRLVLGLHTSVSFHTDFDLYKSYQPRVSPTGPGKGGKP